eukprot:CAMPEP_0118635078 /NCGR_PEP_ID=MMETSP0785-20121206/1885_1 /TAXON_ID=91992 /ORGANISM="Bolidomonas pacifica, Strain CCMP 1866" /LENGTH=159 /DNA_ID=CAMNT_0006526089 /DNA_START=260 /DNA_END=739 /DNA_ORIENTATION=-
MPPPQAVKKPQSTEASGGTPDSTPLRAPTVVKAARPMASKKENAHAVSFTWSDCAKVGHARRVAKQVKIIILKTLGCPGLIQNAGLPLLAPRSTSLIVPPPMATMVANNVAPITPISLFAAVSVPENANATVPKSSNAVRDFGTGNIGCSVGCDIDWGP